MYNNYLEINTVLKRNRNAFNKSRTKHLSHKRRFSPYGQTENAIIQLDMSKLSDHIELTGGNLFRK